MTSIKILIVTLSLIGGIQVAATISFGSCLNSLIESSRHGESGCALITSYSKCVLKKNDASKFTSDVKQHLAKLRTVTTGMMKKAGINCDIDFVKLEEEIRKEDENKLIQHSKTANVYHAASTNQQCLAAYNADILAGNEACSATNEYVKCVIRIESLYKMKVENFRPIGKKIKENFVKNLTHCRIDVSALFKELIHEQKHV